MKSKLLGFLLVGMMSVAGVAYSEAPDWLRRIAIVPASPELVAKAPAAVLMDETTIEIDTKGGYTEIRRVAIRILYNAGSSRAIGYLSYNGASDSVDALNAWLLRKEKTIETKKSNDWLDSANNSQGAVIDERRIYSVNLTDKAVSGDVFGYETKKQGALLVAQFAWGFGSELPVLSESLKLILPAGFTLEAKTYGSEPLPVSTPDSRSWIWVLANRPFRPDEPYTHPTARAEAELLVKLIPPANAPRFSPRNFANWAEVVDYCNTISIGQCDTSAGMVAKAHELVQASMDDLTKIKTLAHYVQQLRYIGINQGLQQGFGFKPRKASVVFATGFGDCKDKANLLVAMLGEVGIKAHPVAAYLGKERVVKAEFPTPTQFNHAIVAIEVGDEMQLPSVVTVEKYGRLLFFDATDPYTKLGDLPASLQGGLVHAEIAGNNFLTLLPSFSAEADYRYDRRLELVLTPEDAVQIKGKVMATGQTGARMRSQFERANMPKQLDELVALQLNDKFRGAAVLDRNTADDPTTGQCTLSFTCVQPKYVQWLQGETGIVKLDLLSRKYLPNFSDKERLLPIGLPPLAINDEIVLVIPQGFVATEFPADSSFQSPYGSCQITCVVQEGELVFKREVLLKESEIAATDYHLLRQFFSDIAKADRATVLLKRQI